MMREITGTGKGPMISIHDGFQGGLTPWSGFLSGSDRIAMDSHPYLAFTNTNNDPMAVQVGKPCASVLKHVRKTAISSWLTFCVVI